jgi:energy-converting hydrogenase Eha subunit H
MPITPFQRRVGIPVIAAVTVAVTAMALDGHFGPRPWVVPFRYGAIVIHIPWLLTLPLVGGGATLLAKRSGATTFQRLLVSISPALTIGGAVNVLMAGVVTVASISGHRVYPTDFIGHFIVGWLVVPAFASFVGSLPFLRSASANPPS